MTADRVTAPADLDVALCVVFLGTTGKLPEGTTSNAEVLAFLRGCTVEEASVLVDALELLDHLRGAAPGIAAQGGALNWTRTIARLAGWDERRAALALAVAEASELLIVGEAEEPS